jgi:hypothetical protein
MDRGCVRRTSRSTGELETDVLPDSASRQDKAGGFLTGGNRGNRGKAPRDRQIIYPKGQTNYLTEVFEGTDKDFIEGTDKFLRDH